jgi:hypothetical protein
MATIVKHTIGEHDIVVLTDTIAKVESVGTWPAGTRGTGISDYGDHKMIDISNELGETLDMPIVAVEKLKLIAAKHS